MQFQIIRVCMTKLLAIYPTIAIYIPMQVSFCLYMCVNAVVSLFCTSDTAIHIDM